jgi:hypothetical protein
MNSAANGGADDLGGSQREGTGDSVLELRNQWSGTGATNLDLQQIQNF